MSTQRHCDFCRHDGVDGAREPCASCVDAWFSDGSSPGWEPKRLTVALTPAEVRDTAVELGLVSPEIPDLDPVAEAPALEPEAPLAGVKHDNGKPPWDLLPWDAVEQIVLVLQFGARKYAPRNWEKGISYSRIFAATCRHLVAWFVRGEDRDPETGLHPLAHAACEVLFALAFAVRKTPGIDDRPVKP